MKKKRTTKKKSKTTDNNPKPHPVSTPSGRISFVADPLARLAYALATDPSPLTVSLPGANPVLAALSFVITNQQPGPVEVESIAFTIQLGDKGTALAASSDQIHTAPSDTTIWKVTPSSSEADDMVTYTLGPQTGSTVTLDSGDSVVLQIYNIATNDAVGVTAIEIKEMVVGNQPAFPEFNVTKFPYGFYFDGLVATVESGSAHVPVAQVGYNGSVRLLWNSSVTEVTAFHVFYATNEGQKATPPPPPQPVTTAGRWDSPPLTRDTVFTVVVNSTTTGGAAVSASMSIPVAVQQPDVVANTLTVAGAATVAGKVGIGTDTPSAPLHVVGGALIDSSETETWQTAFVIRNESSNKAFQFLVGGSENNNGAGVGGFGIYDSVEGFRLNINSNGKVGIGTVTPTARLHVVGGALIDSSETETWQTAFVIRNESSNKAFQFLVGGRANNNEAAGVGGFGIYDSVAGFRFNINANGYVGIGTTAPQAPLHVKPIRPFGATSILAEGAIAAQSFLPFSDARTKNIQGRSDGATDLGTLLGLEVTDYRYKDVIGNGRAAHKKLIAQQVEKVFPQAVGKLTHLVPDVYRRAAFRDGWVELATDLRRGERVRLISDKAEGIFEVLEVTADKFRTEFKPEGDKVFVFGREVDDFRTVDYDAIAMLNVSATQQLKKEKDEEMEAMRAACAELRAANDALLKRVELLERKMGPARRRRKNSRLVTRSLAIGLNRV